MTKPRLHMTLAQPKQKIDSKQKNPHSAGKLELGISPKVIIKSFSSTVTTVVKQRTYTKLSRIKTAALLVLGVAVGIASNGLSGFLSHHSITKDFAASAATYTYINGYPTLNGSYVDCDGSIDNDPAHHTTDAGDTDPGHHLGQNCPAGSVVASASSTTTSPQPVIAAAAQMQPAVQPAASPSMTTSVTSAPSCNQVGSGTFVGCYYSGKNFNTLKLVRTESQINFDWGNGSPDPSLPSDNFSAIWQGGFNFSGGSYTFTVTGDDGVRVSVDGSAIIDKMVDQPATSYSATVNLPAGQHTVKMEYYEAYGSAVAKLGWNLNSAAASAPTPVTLVSSPSSVSSSGNMFAGTSLYVDPYMHSKLQADAWATSQPYNASLLYKIANQPNAFWYGGWNSDVQSDAANVVNAAASKGQMPLMVLYNIPNRDCGGYSAGGAQTPDAYRNFVSAFAKGIGSNKAAVIIEPDGLANIDCMSAQDQQTRIQLINFAVSTLKSLPHTAVYIDAGNPHWIGTNVMAQRLNSAGISQADGFALNVSNFFTTSDNISYGSQLAPMVGGKHFIIDTSRNGNGPTPDYQWCNPSGRALGAQPTANTGNGLVDAFVWAKEPGGSDGSCNGGPSAGQWWADYALGLSQRASW